MSRFVVIALAAFAVVGVSIALLLQQQRIENLLQEKETGEAHDADIPTLIAEEDRMFLGEGCDPSAPFTSAYLPEADVTLRLPCGSTVEQNAAAPDRRAAFAHYAIATKTAAAIPALRQIRLFSAGSIERYAAACALSPSSCAGESDPTLESYQRERDAFEQRAQPDGYGMMESGGRVFLTTHHDCGEECVLRRYTTFLADAKTDIIVRMKSERQASEADRLLHLLRIESAL